MFVYTVHDISVEMCIIRIWWNFSVSSDPTFLFVWFLSLFSLHYAPAFSLFSRKLDWRVLSLLPFYLFPFLSLLSSAESLSLLDLIWIHKSLSGKRFSSFFSLLFIHCFSYFCDEVSRNCFDDDASRRRFLKFLGLSVSLSLGSATDFPYFKSEMKKQPRKCRFYCWWYDGYWKSFFVLFPLNLYRFSGISHINADEIQPHQSTF